MSGLGFKEMTWILLMKDFGKFWISCIKITLIHFRSSKIQLK